jgi:hypothetical protein
MASSSAGYGRIVVANRPGLEAAACECYEVVERRFKRLCNGTGTAPSSRDATT